MKKKFVLILASVCFFALISVSKAQAQSLERDVRTLTMQIFTSMEKDVNNTAVNQQEKNESIRNEFTKAGQIESRLTASNQTTNDVKVSQGPCPAGFYCHHGFCISYWEGEDCLENLDCPDGQICVNGRCVVWGGIQCD
ncbi:EB domain-containing protein [Chitinophaga niabensis]|uniref:Dickkopf N-terminal cysteine-rich domain-containing protein n=1 Tax=Chitinophaga niabensis TaxID=536979 RepID=A0A1N6HHG1_9BACT|nr:EB domain-containing protein [Chitinophaga niabensis]SIO19304.1 hypothetical protein SAMN04488055_3387 [Chitinophaga niabensis]